MMGTMEKIELEQNEINVLVYLVRERLLLMDDELKEAREFKPTLAFFWDLYQKLLSKSTMPGIRAKENPYR